MHLASAPVTKDKMRLDRRSVLTLLAATGLGPAFSVSARASGADPRALVLVLDDLAPGLSTDHLRAVLAPLVERGIPAGLILKPGAAGFHPALATFLCRFFAEYPGLGEPVAWAADLGAATGYFQSRAASRARAGFEAGLARRDPKVALPVPVSIATPASAGQEFGFDAVRTAGFRNVLLLDQGLVPTASVACQTNAVCMRGGARHRLVDGPPPLAKWIGGDGAASGLMQIVLSLEGIGALSATEIGHRAEALALLIDAQIAAGLAFVMSPREHVVWFEQAQDRACLILIDPPPPDAVQGFAALTQALDAAGVAYSVAGAGAPPLCLSLVPEPGLTVPEWAARLTDSGTDCLRGDPDPGTTARLAEAGLRLVLHRTPEAPLGMDGNGLFHLRDTLTLDGAPDAAARLAALDITRDIVLGVTAAAYAAPAPRAALVQMLQDLNARDATRLATLPQFADRIAPADPALALLREMRADMAATPTPILPDPESEAALLLDDARQAWRFIDTMTEPVTGLCPATVFFAGIWTSSYRVLTMWDLASLLGGVMAAHELGLIDDVSFVARVETILGALPVITLNGHRLPPSEIATDRKAVVTADFNAYDTIRLLSVLREFEAHPLTTGLAAGLVAGWDIAPMVRGGHLYSVTSGRLEDTFRSQCSHYGARALGGWGIAAQSPYDLPPVETGTDGQMQVLSRAAWLGLLGAEPLLLEAVEMGLSAPSAVLADVLYSAQRRAHAQSGVFHAVSETVLDSPPWFAYHGLRIDDARNRWGMTVLQADAAFQTEAFRRKAEVINTKAAYLWSAIRPGGYSAALLDHVRPRIRVADGGLSPGIYAASGHSMTDYTDINTNGIVLQAIAYILRGRKPRAPLV